METKVHEGESCPQCGNNSYIRKSTKSFACNQCGSELTVMSECGNFLMCSENVISDAKERFFLSDEQSKKKFTQVPIMINSNGRPNQDTIVTGPSFLDNIEAFSKLGSTLEVERLVRTWKQLASKIPEYNGPDNTLCALCSKDFRRFKLFRRHSVVNAVVNGVKIDFQVHDKCLNRYAKALSKVDLL